MNIADLLVLQTTQSQALMLEMRAARAAVALPANLNNQLRRAILAGLPITRHDIIRQCTRLGIPANPQLSLLIL